MRRAFAALSLAAALAGAWAPPAAAEEDESFEGEEAATGPAAEEEGDFARPESEVTLPGRPVPPEAAVPAPGQQGDAEQGETGLPQPKRRAQAGRQRERDAEGTQALDRFKANTVIESQYKLDGKPLEVDPD